MKINYDYLKSFENNDNLKYFGNWVNNIDKIHQEYQNKKPFSYIVIDNFLKKEYCDKIEEKFPLDIENYHKYYNPIEVKYARDDINNLPNDIKNLFYILSTKQMIEIFSKITGINNLEFDPHLHGAGLHLHPRLGRLNLHLDYEKHPILENKQRRLNIILYLNKNWNSEWNGATELWNDKVSECIYKSDIVFNKAIIFQTNEISFHGLPEKILCPENEFRKSFAYYYISDLETKKDNNKFGSNKDGFRTKATFIKRPSDEDLIQMKKLYEIRPNRRITQDDMNEIWPEWSPELF
jgi:Rps23 Pro-64 3,4-dihydroxylase Tpa1-like proline 4-hydroxylase